MSGASFRHLLGVLLGLSLFLFSSHGYRLLGVERLRGGRDGRSRKRNLTTLGAQGFMDDREEPKENTRVVDETHPRVKAILSEKEREMRRRRISKDRGARERAERQRRGLQGLWKPQKTSSRLQGVRPMDPRALSCFVQVHPGLEAAVAKELAQLGVKDAKEAEGGGGFDCVVDIETLFKLNLWSRTASRFLVRVAQFIAHDFGGLEAAFDEIDWTPLIRKNRKVRVRVSADASSRLFHSGAIEQRVCNWIKRNSQAASVKTSAAEEADIDVSKTPYEQHILVRVKDNVVTVSIDSTGAALSYRGYRKWVGKAPLNENMAAAAIMMTGRWRPKRWFGVRAQCERRLEEREKRRAEEKEERRLKETEKHQIEEDEGEKRKAALRLASLQSRRDGASLEEIANEKEETLKALDDFLSAAEGDAERGESESNASEGEEEDGGIFEETDEREEGEEYVEGEDADDEEEETDSDEEEGMGESLYRHAEEEEMESADLRMETGAVGFEEELEEDEDADEFSDDEEEEEEESSVSFEEEEQGEEEEFASERRYGLSPVVEKEEVNTKQSNASSVRVPAEEVDAVDVWPPFLDPLCGSGTLPIEAALIATDRAPGLMRKFSLDAWPAVEGAPFLENCRREAMRRFEIGLREWKLQEEFQRLHTEQREAEKLANLTRYNAIRGLPADEETSRVLLMAAEVKKKGENCTAEDITEQRERARQKAEKERDFMIFISGSDRDDGAILGAKGNACRAGIDSVVKFGRHALSDAPRTARTIMPQVSGLLLTNPPYGARLDATSKLKLRDLYDKLGAIIHKDLWSWKCFFLAGTPELALRLKNAARCAFKTKRSMLHGGIHVDMWGNAAFKFGMDKKCVVEVQRKKKKTSQGRKELKKELRKKRAEKENRRHEKKQMRKQSKAALQAAATGKTRHTFTRENGMWVDRGKGSGGAGQQGGRPAFRNRAASSSARQKSGETPSLREFTA